MSRKSGTLTDPEYLGPVQGCCGMKKKTEHLHLPVPRLTLLLIYPNMHSISGGINLNKD
jgi:hypothetical protein